MKTEIRDIRLYKDCIKAETTLELITTDIQRFKISEECTQYLSMYERGQLAQAQDLLVALAQKYRERVITEEIR